MLHQAKSKSVVILGIMPALLLAGCGNSKSEEALEMRIAAAEAKAEAADKRSREALSMAASGSGSPNNSAEVVPDEIAMDQGVTDDSADSVIYDNRIESPPSPPIGPAG